jgi:hypothetical protein
LLVVHTRRHETVAATLIMLGGAVCGAPGGSGPSIHLP